MPKSKKQSSDADRAPMRIQWTLIAALIFALITAIFAVINVDPVQVNFLFGTFNAPLILLILGCTLLGAIIVGSYSIYTQYRTHRKLKLVEAQLAEVLEATGYVFTKPEAEVKKDKTKELKDSPSSEL